MITDAQVEAACDAYNRHPDCRRLDNAAAMRAALEAAAQAANVEALAVVEAIPLQHLAAAQAAPAPHPDSILPDCMMPDGGECCAGYRALHKAWAAAEDKRMMKIVRTEAGHYFIGDSRFCIKPVTLVGSRHSWAVHDAEWVSEHDVAAGHYAPCVGQFYELHAAFNFVEMAMKGEIDTSPVLGLNV